MFFSVDDSFRLNTAGQVTVVVEYLDAGVNVIDLKYLDVNGREIGPVNRIWVNLSNIGLFRTAAAVVTDASFGNAMSFANDLRLDTDVPGGMVVRSLTVQRPCILPAAVAGPAPPAVPAGQHRHLLPVGPRNACG
jgi:hypothetical protein